MAPSHWFPFKAVLGANILLKPPFTGNPEEIHFLVQGFPCKIHKCPYQVPSKRPLKKRI